MSAFLAAAALPLLQYSLLILAAILFVCSRLSGAVGRHEGRTSCMQAAVHVSVIVMSDTGRHDEDW